MRMPEKSAIARQLQGERERGGVERRVASVTAAQTSCRITWCLRIEQERALKGHRGPTVGRRRRAGLRRRRRHAGSGALRAHFPQAARGAGAFALHLTFHITCYFG